MVVPASVEKRKWTPSQMRALAISVMSWVELV